VFVRVRSEKIVRARNATARENWECKSHDHRRQ
jgi:hypothetical protein